MSEIIAVKAPRRRRKRILIAVLLTLLSLLAVLAVIVYPTWRTRRLVKQYAAQEITYDVVIAKLGGAAEAADRLSDYLEKPKWLAPSKEHVPGLLWRCGKRCVPILIKTLDHEDLAVRMCAASALGHMGKDAAEAVPALIANLAPAYPYMKKSAAEALGRIGASARDSLAALKLLLGDSDKEVRTAAAIAIWRIRNATERSDPDRALSPMPQASRFSKVIGKKAYPAVAAPDKAPLLRWDFSAKRKYSYNYTRKEDIYNDLVGLRAPTKRSTEITGDLVLTSKAKGFASVMLQNLKPRVLTSGVLALPKNSVVALRMNEIGNVTFPLADSGMSLAMRMLLALPPQPLKTGESIDLPVEMPWEVPGATMQVTGHLKMKLTGYVIAGSRKCARLENSIDIPKFKAPQGTKGTYKVFLKGKSIVHFDLQARSFLSAELALLGSFRMDAPNPNAATTTTRPSPIGKLKRYKGASDTDTLIIITQQKRPGDKAGAAPRSRPPPRL